MNSKTRAQDREDQGAQPLAEDGGDRAERIAGRNPSGATASSTPAPGASKGSPPEDKKDLA